MSAPIDLEEVLKTTMLVDRYRLRRMGPGGNTGRRGKADGEAKPTAGTEPTKFETELAKSQRIFQQRLAAKPVCKYDDDLPICLRREEIAALIRDHQVVVVCGETGSGKSTQLPKICLDLGRGIAGMIGHTQPRRIAARSVAARVADELGVPAGREVGFKVRFSDVTSPNTLIKLMTDGILLAETQSDKWLNRYDTIIVDEAHERSLNIDFLLGNLHRLVAQRPDLKVIITSATIDARRFAEHFASVAGDVPVIEVSGRMYPVEIRYRPPTGDADGQEPDLEQAVADAVAEVTAQGPGDVLVFMPTEREIHEAAKVLKGRSFGGAKAELLPLYARLSAAEQQRVFQPASHRRIVIATNVAESSLTVPGIRYVVDTGTARISRYSPKSKLKRLPIEEVSQASANQRAGRCGRLGPGVCIRLYSEADFQGRERFTPPEILRSNLADVILQTKTLRLGPIEDFPFLEPPKPEAIRDGYKTLFEVGAVDERHELTPLGRRLARLPVDPRIARIIWAAVDEQCLAEILIIASALELQDPRERPLEKQQQADEAHARFADEESDFLSYLKLWDFYHQLKSQISKSQLRKACSQHFLSWSRLREWSEVHAELVSIVRETLAGDFSADEPASRNEAASRNANERTQRNLKNPSPPAPRPAKPGRGVSIQVGSQPPRHSALDTLLTERRGDFAAIHRALMTGFLSSLALRTETGEYQVAGGQKAFLWPGSGLAKKKPKWIVAAELVETTRRFLRTTARIDPNWIEPLAGHLLNRSYSEPHWDREALSVMAFEKVLLFGLPIVPRRQVRYGRIDPVISRELFVWQGLVHGEWGPENFYEQSLEAAGRSAVATPELRSRLPVSESAAKRGSFSKGAAGAEGRSNEADVGVKAIARTPALPPFLSQNLALVKQIDEMQARSRRGNLMRDEQAQFEFYSSRIPREVVDGIQLLNWLRTALPDERSRLQMTEADLLEETAVLSTKEFYPDALQMRGLSLPLTYQLDPGGDDDGVTVIVPQEALNQLDGERMEWLVPGLIVDKIEAMLKTLPKDARRVLVPIPETASRIASELEFGKGGLADAVIRGINQVAGISLAREEFDEARLPYFLKMQIRVTDASGKTLATGRDLVTLRQQFGGIAASSFSSADDPRWNRDGLKSWEFGSLPEEVSVVRSGVAMKGYPTLLDTGEAVSLRLVDSPTRAIHELRFGLRRLICHVAARELKQQVDHLPQLTNWTLMAKTFPQPFPFRQHVTELIADRAYLSHLPLPRNESQFTDCLKGGKLRLATAAGEVAQLVGTLLQTFADIRKAWEKSAQPQWAASRQDVHLQLSQLFAPGFLVRTPWSWLVHFPRFGSAIVLRLQKLTTGAGARDQQQLATVSRLWQRGIARQKEHQNRQCHDPELELYRWMTEEFRVSIFAQELGTSLPVSEKRLDQQWQRVTE